MRRAVVAVLPLVGLIASGCVGHTVYNRTPLAHPSEAPPAGTFVLGTVSYDPNLGIDKGIPFVLEFEQALRRRLLETGAASDVAEERTLGPSGVGGRAFVLRARIVDAEHVQHDVPAGAWVIQVLGCATMLCIPLPIVTAMRQDQDQMLRVQLRLFDVTDRPVVQITDERSSERINVYDTAQLDPLFVAEFEVSGRVGFQLLDGPSERDLNRMGAELADELATQLLNQSLPRILRAIRNSTPPVHRPEVSPAAATSL